MVLRSSNTRKTGVSNSSCGSDATSTDDGANGKLYRTLQEMPRKLRKENPYIHTAYRHNIGWKRSCDSACDLHNETLNVWTHIFGALSMCVLICSLLLTISPHGADWMTLKVLPAAALNGASSKPCVCRLDGGESSVILSGLTSGLLRGGGLVSLPEDQLCEERRLREHNPWNNLLHALSSLSERYAAVKEGEWSSESRERFLVYVEAMRNQVESHLPRMDLLAESLKRRIDYGWEADSAGDGLRERFKSYLHSLQDKLTLVKASMENLDPRGSLSNLGKQVQELKQALGEQYSASRATGTGTGPVLSYVFHNEKFDMVKATNHILDAFRRAQADPDHNIMGIETGFAIFLDPLMDPSQVQSYLSRWPLLVFMCSAFLCLSFSATYHLFCGVSKKVAQQLQQLDYSGICLLITGSSLPMVYYGLYCHTQRRNVYMGINVLVGALNFAACILPRFNHIKYRAMKVGFFVLAACVDFIPVLDIVFTMGFVHDVIYYTLLSCASYLLGAMIYVKQVPEAWWPGKFDYFASSHQLWHVFVFTAVLIHYKGLMLLYKWRMVTTC